MAVLDVSALGSCKDLFRPGIEMLMWTWILFILKLHFRMKMYLCGQSLRSLVYLKVMHNNTATQDISADTPASDCV